MSVRIRKNLSSASLSYTSTQLLKFIRLMVISMSLVGLVSSAAGSLAFKLTTAPPMNTIWFLRLQSACVTSATTPILMILFSIQDSLF